MTDHKDESSLHRSVRLLYHGRSQKAAIFRYALVAFDVATIIYFLLTVAAAQQPLIIVINLILGVLILLDFGARLWVATDGQG